MSDKTKSYFCPSCNSPLVNLPALAGGEASCQKCTWKGPNTELLGYEFKTGFDNAEEILHAFARDIRLLMAQNESGLKMGQLIIKWGLVQNVDVPTLSRYVGNVARAIAVSVLETRKDIEKEKQSVS